MKTLKDMLLERSVNPQERLGCLMAMVEKETCQKLLAFNHKIISDDIVYHKIDADGKDEFGREKECHVTIRYGFVEDLNEIEVRELLDGQKKFDVEIVGLSIFDSNPEFDVVKLDVKSEVLERLNQISGMYPNKSDFPVYHPHLTLAYVKKGTFNIKKELNISVTINNVCYSPIAGSKSYFELNEGQSFDIDAQIARLEQEWERLDSMAVTSARQNQISDELVKLRKEKEKQQQNTFVEPGSPTAKDWFQKMRTQLAEDYDIDKVPLNEWISHAPAMNRNPDSQLRPVPGGWNDNSPNWDGVVEGKDWWGYIGENDWNKKQSWAAVYINEDEKPYRMWIKIKTHRLRKPNDTNQSYKDRVRKHTTKVAKAWMTAARKIHNNPDLNEVGNPIQKSWKDSFREAIDDLKVKQFLAEKGEEVMADPVNFTPRVGENMEKKKISYSAVVLNDESHQKLLTQFKKNVHSDWKKFAHHMTIKMGELPEDKKEDIGKEVELTVTAVGQSKTNSAVKVSGYYSTNSTPHITLAVDVNNGGKPVDSNKISNWLPVSEPFKVKGTVKEIGY